MSSLLRKLRLGRAGWKLALVFLFVGVSALGWCIAIYRKQQTIGEIERLNGLATSRYQILGAPSLFQFGPVDDVYFLGPQVDDGNLRVLQKVPELRILTLTNTRVTDDGLAQLGRFKHLNCLYIANIDHTKLIGAAGARLQTNPLITGKGLESLKGLPNLQVVQLIGSGTTDEDLQALGHLKNLVMLDLKDTRVTNTGMARLKKMLPNCKISLR